VARRQCGQGAVKAQRREIEDVLHGGVIAPHRAGVIDVWRGGGVGPEKGL